jgi:hypothetical protein
MEREIFESPAARGIGTYAFQLELETPQFLAVLYYTKGIPSPGGGSQASVSARLRYANACRHQAGLASAYRSRAVMPLQLAALQIRVLSRPVLKHGPRSLTCESHWDQV